MKMFRDAFSCMELVNKMYAMTGKEKGAKSLSESLLMFCKISRTCFIYSQATQVHSLGSK